MIADSRELGKPVMADVDTIEAAAEAAGADLIATTLTATPPQLNIFLSGFDLLSWYNG